MPQLIFVRTRDPGLPPGNVGNATLSHFFVIGKVDLLAAPPAWESVCVHWIVSGRRELKVVQFLDV